MASVFAKPVDNYHLSLTFLLMDYYNLLYCGGDLLCREANFTFSSR